MHKNSNLRTRNAPSLKITLTSGAFFRVHISIYYNVKTKQSETFPSKLPDTNLDCPAVKHTYIMHWANGRVQTKTNWNSGDIFSQHSVAVSGRIPANCIVSYSNTCFGRFTGEGWEKDSTPTKVWDFSSFFEQWTIFIIYYLLFRYQQFVTSTWF